MFKTVLSILLIYTTIMGGLTGSITSKVEAPSIEDAFCQMLYNEYISGKASEEEVTVQDSPIEEVNTEQ